MKITLLSIGKTDNGYLKEGISEYLNRLRHYTSFEIIEIPALKKASSLNPEIIKQKEADLILKHLKKPDFIVLLDENGKQMSSKDFSVFLQKRMNASVKEIVFVIGGAWGFGQRLQERANYKLSLSKMTFSHQMVRLFFVEQLYRAFTILRGEAYHNE